MKCEMGRDLSFVCMCVELWWFLLSCCLERSKRNFLSFFFFFFLSDSLWLSQWEEWEENGESSYKSWELLDFQESQRRDLQHYWRPLCMLYTLVQHSYSLSVSLFHSLARFFHSFPKSWFFFSFLLLQSWFCMFLVDKKKPILINFQDLTAFKSETDYNDKKRGFFF